MRNQFCVLIAVTGLMLQRPGECAATYSQTFDDVAGGTAALAAQGWQFRDQSSAVGKSWWQSGWSVSPGGIVDPSQAGAGYLAFAGTSNIQDSVAVSAWAILPTISGQVAGDVLSLYSRGAAFNPSMFSGAAQIEVRYSPTGSTSTGSGSASLGDFTTLLKTIVPAEQAPYVETQVIVPGTGRLAFRLFAANVPLFAWSPFLQLDTLQFNPPPPPFPIPAAGETVTWTLAHSPILITSDVAIPAGGTVLVDPGVQIRVSAGRHLDVIGTLIAHGTQNARVRIQQLGAGAELIPWPDAWLQLEHTIVDLYVHPKNGPTILASDCNFTGNGFIGNAFDGLLDPRRSVLRLDRCVFQGSSVQMENLVAALRDVEFQQQTIFTDLLLLGYVLLDDVTVDGTTIWLGKEKGVQPIFVDGVTVMNSAAHGGLLLMNGTDFLLGPGNSFTNNLWPIEFGSRCAGLLPGSVVPASGNTNNYVVDTDDFDPQTSVTWGKLDVPYVVRQTRFLGRQRIHPGARIQFMPFTAWQADPFGSLTANGTAAEPIVFERFDPGQAWQGISLFNPGRAQRLEHCVFRGAQRAVVSLAAQLDSCRFENCAEGLFSGAESWTQARSCEFHGNAVGVTSFNPAPGIDGALLLAGGANPNVFSGNTVAVRTSPGVGTTDATANWWGHPSGPYHPLLNPAGQGDAVETAGPLVFQPFLTAAPDLSDTPPQVSFLDDGTLVAEPGITLLLSWTGTDDVTIASQRLLFSPNGNYPGTFQVVQQLFADQRTVAFTVPTVGLQQNGASAFLRLEAFDDQGHLGHDELELFILDPSIAGTLSITADLTGPFRPGDALPLTYVTTGIDPVVAPSASGALLLDGDGDAFSLGGATYSLGMIPGDLVLPDVSTDRARVAIALAASQNRQEWFFSDWFTIRPSPLIGDAAPTIALNSPTAGEIFLSGQDLPIRWTASDDEELRGFDVLASTDGGRRYTRVASDLSQTATGYDWPLPHGVETSDLRIRVVVRDRRFQNSAADATCTVLSGNTCQSDLGYGTVGGPTLAICGAPLSPGNFATLSLTGAPASQPGLLFLSTVFQPVNFLGGTLVTVPVAIALPIATSAGGHLTLSPIPGGSGPFTFFLQAVVAAPAAPFGATLSNALSVALLP